MKSLTAVAFSTVLAFGFVSGSAEAGKRTSTLTGPGGNVWTSTGERVCADGVCNYSGQTVGPRGTWTRNSQAVRNPDGSISTQGTVTSPRGRVWKRSGTIVVGQ
jgi:hypothetical protein